MKRSQAFSLENSINSTCHHALVFSKFFKDSAAVLSLQHFFRAMATTKFFFFLSMCSLFLVALPAASNGHRLGSCHYDAIYQLGDSLADTGNLIREDPSSFYARLPYGRSFFHNATGRCSNGLLMIDYIALAAGVPLLEPYLKKNARFTHGNGVNFAVAGSTALPVESLAQKKIIASRTKSSLSTQLDWMSTYFNGICYNNKDCARKLENALFIVGEIGGNDYNYALFQGQTIQQVQDLVPDVVRAIKDAVETVIGFGARTVIVPGNFPIGCLPIYLTGFKTKDTRAYDEFHCLKRLNNLSVSHNTQLKQAILQLRKAHPNVAIAYGNYYNAFLWILGHAPFLGYDTKSLQRACCGTGGDYNFNLAKMCGVPGVPVCLKPQQFLSWDGIHLTQKAYLHIALFLLRTSFRELHCFA